MHVSQKPDQTLQLFQRVSALVEIIIVCAIAKLWGTADAAIAAMLLLVLRRWSVLVQSFNSAKSLRSIFRIAALFTVAIWICILLFTQLLPLVGLLKPDYSIFVEQFQSNPVALISILLKVWTTVAFGEEILGRVFLLTALKLFLMEFPVLLNCQSFYPQSCLE